MRKCAERNFTRSEAAFEPGAWFTHAEAYPFPVAAFALSVEIASYPLFQMLLRPLADLVERPVP
jgi:hypothetical protein